MNISLGAKKDVYTGVRCISSGILLGRMAAGLASFERNLESKGWSPSYAAHFGAEAAYKAAQQIERLQTTARLPLKSFEAKMEPYKNWDSFSYVNKGKAYQDAAGAKSDLAAIAQLVAKTCGKRRPAEGEGAALVEMKNIKREKAPRPPKDVPMELPSLVPDEPVLIPVEAAQESSVWPVVVGVLMVIGATFFVR